MLFNNIKLKSKAQFFVYSNIWVSFCVLGLALSSEILLQTSNTHLLQFVFFSTLFIYNFHRLVRVYKGHCHVRKAWLQKNKKSVFFLMLCSLAVSLYKFIDFRLITQTVIFLLAVISASYPFGLRKIPFFKIVIISFAWSISTMLLLVVENEARIYRNFIEGAGPRAIGVGYPDDINIAYDANNMRIALIWQGDFIDAKRHWNGRGQGFQPPSGESILKGTPGVPFAVIDSPNDPWPSTYFRKDNAQLPPLEDGFFFKGYQLTGKERIPSFNYNFGELKIVDSPVPSTVDDSSESTLVRTLTLKGENKDHLYFRAGVGESIELVEDNTYLVDDLSAISIKSMEKPIIRDSEGKKELLVPIKFINNSAEITQTISWQ